MLRFVAHLAMAVGLVAFGVQLGSYLERPAGRQRMLFQACSTLALSCMMFLLAQRKPANAQRPPVWRSFLVILVGIAGGVLLWGLLRR